MSLHIEGLTTVLQPKRKYLIPDPDFRNIYLDILL